MSVIDRHSVLKNPRVREVMRHAPRTLPPEAPIERAIRWMIKYKANALLIRSPGTAGIGVVSKTDVMGAYYAGFPLDTPVEGIMTGPPIFCSPLDDLVFALELMQARRVHRVYVADANDGLVGVLAYPDIVGLLYRFCQRCDRNRLFRSGRESTEPPEEHLRVRDVMSFGVKSHGPEETLMTIIESLSSQRLGAVLIVHVDGRAVGVISKTDLIIAYRHGTSIDQPVGQVMNRSVETVRPGDLLMAAVQRMIFSDYHRVFVTQDESFSVIGVLTLSDAARARSGSCHACVVSRVGPQTA